MKRVILHHIFKKRSGRNYGVSSWITKLHSVKPVIGAMPVMPMRRTDVKLTRLRTGHTRLTHRHLFENTLLNVSAVPIFLPDDRYIASLVGLRGPNTHSPSGGSPPLGERRQGEPAPVNRLVVLLFGVPEETLCRVSAADKGCRVYPLDPRPDAVALYSGCTSGKRRAWFLPDDRHTASLLDSVVGGGTPG
ncbi:uncharacterized protein TNCV_4310351 [Trichonephila clavipes]|nr:uncharacterized protein TNCV_4310351 [Trichonephila clavipes]